jgi:hypothetical protein
MDMAGLVIASDDDERLFCRYNSVFAIAIRDD